MRKIFVIEDNDLNYLLVEEILSDYNVELIRARDGEEFYSKIKQPVNFDLILMDMMLPDTNGIILTKFLIRENYNIPIIFMSASIEKYKDISDLGVKNFIPKPFIEEEFIFNLRKYVEIARLKECA
jgi:CheY-like chemotaxis protein